MIYHVEKFSEDVAEMIGSHHIETTINNKELEKQIQQRLAGKKIARTNRLNKNEREANALKLINVSVNEWGSAGSEQSSEPDNINEEESQSIEENNNKPRPINYYYDNSDEASLSGDEARIDEFHVSAEADDSEEEDSDRSGEEDVHLDDRRATKRAKTNLDDESINGTIYVDWLATKK